MGFLKDKTKTTPGILPEQREALNMLLSTAQQGQVPYSGDFSLDLPGLDTLLQRYEGGQLLPERYQTILDDLLNLKPVNQTEEFQKRSEIAKRASMDAANAIFGKAAKGGARYSSSAIAAGVGEAAKVRSQAELATLQEAARAEEINRQRKAALLNLAGQLYQGMQAGVIDSAKLRMAAQQWEKGMSYEEFKRQHPDVYKLLTAIWGRNVDFMMQKQPSMFSTILGTVGQIASIVNPVDNVATDIAWALGGGGP